MNQKNKSIKLIIALGLAFMMIFSSNLTGFGISVVNVYASANNNEATIRMGDNAPMTRTEFLAWANQRGIRHFSVDGRIYPAGIFFNGYGGQSFTYGELNGAILDVSLRAGVVSNNVGVSASTGVSTQATPSTTLGNQNLSSNENPNNNPGNLPPMLFECLTPVLFSDAELADLIERAPQGGALYTRSSITLPNRSLTEAELATWIDEYNEMGGATDFELGVIREINRIRVEHGLHPLALDPALLMASRLKAQEFGDLQYYSHTSPVHGSPTEAAQMFEFEGIVWEAISRTGSNSAPVAPNPQDPPAGMLASMRGHRDILLSPYVTSVGVGSFFSPNSTGSSGNLTHSFYTVIQFGLD